MCYIETHNHCLEEKLYLVAQIQSLKHSLFGLFPFLNKHCEEGFVHSWTFQDCSQGEGGLLVLFGGDESKGLNFLRTSVTKEVCLERSKSGQFY